MAGLVFSPWLGIGRGGMQKCGGPYGCVRRVRDFFFPALRRKNDSNFIVNASWLRSAILGDLRVTLLGLDFDSSVDGTGNESWTERDARRGRIRGEEHRRLILGLLKFEESTAVPAGKTGLSKRLGKPGDLVDPKWSMVIVGISVLERRRRDLTSRVYSESFSERCPGGLSTVPDWSEKDRTIRGLLSFRGKWGRAWNDCTRGGLLKGKNILKSTASTLNEKPKEAYKSPAV
jgi:hypothetical protein